MLPPRMNWVASQPAIKPINKNPIKSISIHPPAVGFEDESMINNRKAKRECRVRLAPTLASVFYPDRGTGHTGRPPLDEDAMKPAIPLCIALLLILPKPLASDLSSYAFVNDDGSLRIDNRTVRLHGIIIPPTNRVYQRNVSPTACAPQAALALNFKIGVNFVHCDIERRQPNGDAIARCTVNDEDLAAWLIQQGWAAAAPDAPPEYVVLEKIARQRGIGVWGIPLGG
jgi:endonuclease YncB( thermonuclease family)